MGLYAAYGSNMDPAQMLRRCPSSPHTGTGLDPRLAADLRRRGVRLGGRAGDPRARRRRPDPGVFVALYDLTEADERALDAWEGADSGLYRRCTCGCTPWPATWSPTSTSWTPSRAACPRPGTWAAIADAAEAAGAPTDYVTALRSRECRTAF